MDLINYIKDSLQPKDTLEWIYEDAFDSKKFMNMKQDGIYVSKSKPFNVSKNDIEYILLEQYYISRRTIRQIAWLKHDNTFEWDNTSESLYRRLLPPPVETVNHTFIINCIIKYYKEYVNNNINYLEYGVRSGENFLNVKRNVENTHGVDIVIQKQLSNINDSKIKLYKMTTNEFQSKILSTLDNFDIVFIDADHSSKSVINDFKGVIDKVNPGIYYIT